MYWEHHETGDRYDTEEELYEAAEAEIDDTDLAEALADLVNTVSMSVLMQHFDAELISFIRNNAIEVYIDSYFIEHEDDEDEEDGFEPEWSY